MLLTLCSWLRANIARWKRGLAGDVTITSPTQAISQKEAPYGKDVSNDFHTVNHYSFSLAPSLLRRLPKPTLCSPSRSPALLALPAALPS